MRSALVLAGLVLIACTKKQQDAPPPSKPEAPRTQAVLQLDEQKPPAAPAAAIDSGEEKLQLIAIEHGRPPPTAEAPRSAPSDEAEWRKRFHDAHERIDTFELRVARAQELVGNADYAKTLEGATGLPSHHPAGYEDAKQLLEHADEEREAAKRALEDLEHEAANAGIPLEWRR